jgi:phosphate uptake regulator
MNISINIERDMNMEIRKIQRTGGSTFIVSLPKQWADRVGVTNGMNVGITIRPDGTLLITPNTSSPSPTQNKLDVTGKSGDVLRTISISICKTDVLNCKFHAK